jgi:hypothetical protein
MTRNKTDCEFLCNLTRAAKLAYLKVAGKIRCKKWADLHGNTPPEPLPRCAKIIEGEGVTKLQFVSYFIFIQQINDSVDYRWCP